MIVLFVLVLGLGSFSESSEDIIHADGSHVKGKMICI